MGSLSSKHVLKALVWLQYLRKKIQLARGRNHQQLFPSFSLKPETPTAPFMPPVYPSACAHTRMQQDKLGTRSKVRGYCRTVTHQRSCFLASQCVFLSVCAPCVSPSLSLYGCVQVGVAPPTPLSVMALLNVYKIHACLYSSCLCL